MRWVKHQSNDRPKQLRTNTASVSVVLDDDHPAAMESAYVINRNPAS